MLKRVYGNQGVGSLIFITLVIVNKHHCSHLLPNLILIPVFLWIVRNLIPSGKL